MRIWTCVLPILLCGGGIGPSPNSAQAEVVWLKNGGRIEGELVNANELDPKAYDIKIAGGGRVTVSVSQVDRVVAKSDELRAYEALLPRVPNTLEGQWEMAEYCRKAGLKPQREVHLYKVLQFDADHAAARRALGFSQIDGAWVKPDQWMQNQGYVRHRGAWRLAQEIELENRRDRAEEAEREWRNKIRLWRIAILKNRNDAEDALQQLRAIKDYAALPALADLLTDPAEPKQLKTLYLEILGSVPCPTSSNALLKAALAAPNSEIGNRCLDQLKRHDTDFAVAILVKLLKDKDNDVVNRAGWALGRLENPKAIPDLIEALVTRHRTRIGGGGGNMNLGFGSGGSGMVAGSGSKVVERDLQNKQVHAALASLVPAGVNYGYNIQAWKDWYASRELQAGVDLRRDP